MLPKQIFKDKDNKDGVKNTDLSKYKHKEPARKEEGKLYFCPERNQASSKCKSALAAAAQAERARAHWHVHQDP